MTALGHSLCHAGAHPLHRRGHDQHPFTETPRALFELNIALRQPQERNHPNWFGLRRLSPKVQQLFDLIPLPGYSVGFLRLPAVEDIEEVLDQIYALPAADSVVLQGRIPCAGRERRTPAVSDLPDAP